MSNAFLNLLVEWMLQHPFVSKSTKTHLQFLQGSREFGTSRSVKRKLVEILEIVNLTPFRGLNLIVSFTSDEIHQIARGLGTRYAAAACETRTLESFAECGKKTRTTTSILTCFICDYNLDLESKSDDHEKVTECYYDDCGMCCHLSCLLDHFRSMREDARDEDETDVRGECPQCQQMLWWSLLTRHCGQKKAERKRKRCGRIERIQEKRCGSSSDATEEKTECYDAVKLAAADTAATLCGDSRDTMCGFSSTFTERYDSEGWFEGEVETDYQDDVHEDVIAACTWTSTTICEGQIPPHSQKEAETIDLTED